MFYAVAPSPFSNIPPVFLTHLHLNTRADRNTSGRSLVTVQQK